MAKDYVRYAKMCPDIHIQRDALKRLANTYIEIDSSPDPFGGGDGQEVERGSEESLALFGALEIEELEETDLAWLKKFSRVRGVLFFREMRDILPTEIKQDDEYSEGFEDEG